MSKVTNAHSTTRRQILVAAPAALVTGSIPAPAAATAICVTPELQVLWQRYDELRIEAVKFVKSDFDRHCAAIDARHPIEEEIMTFPTQTLGDVIILAKVAQHQMTDDPEVDLPWDDFVKYLVPAVLKLA